MKSLRPVGPAKARFTATAMAATFLLLAGCGQQVDLYDYFGDSSPAAGSPANSGGAQPANALAGNSALGLTDAELANARPTETGIQKVSLKDAQGVAVTVDDLPVTNFDISQRINLENALGARMTTDLPTQRNVLGTLVNEKVAKSQAKKLNFEIKDKELDERIDNMVGRMKISRAELQKQLSEKGVDEATLKSQIEGTLYVRWVMSQQQVDTNIKVDQALVDSKYNEIISDPRMKPITVVTLLQVDLPVEKTTEAMRQQLLYARSIESRQIMERYKGCKTIKAASQDVFNVKIGQPIEADMSKLPLPMKEALNQAGTDKLIGPIPGPTGVRLFANCGTRKVSPPLPDRKQIEATVRNEQFEALVEQAMTEARKESFVDYKDPAFRP